MKNFVWRAVGPVSLAQAGCACLCRSQAWDAKIVTSAWWVTHDQVGHSASCFFAASRTCSISIPSSSGALMRTELALVWGFL